MFKLASFIPYHFPDRFTINFQTGESVGDDIPFHISLKLGNHVALNTFRNGSWETEESVSDKPFTRGSALNMFIVIKLEGYEVCTVFQRFNH